MTLRYVIYDFNTGNLSTIEVFDTYKEAAESIDPRCESLFVAAIELPLNDEEPKTPNQENTCHTS